MRALLVTTILLCAACTPTTYDPLRDQPDYVERVLQDVTAMLEGMANAHSGDRVVVRDLNFRSSAPSPEPPDGTDTLHSRAPTAAPR